MTNFTALRTIRVLRPLRSVKKVKEIKLLVDSLLQSLPALANVVLFLIFIFIVFGIIGVSFFKGALYQRCRYTSEPKDGDWPADPDIEDLCAMDSVGLFEWPDGRHWGLPGDYDMFEWEYYREAELEALDWGIPNFDDLLSACLTIFQVMTLEGWNKLMYNYYNAGNPYFLSIYFSAIVLLITFFILDLMMATIWTTFKKVAWDLNTSNQQEEEQSDFTSRIESVPHLNLEKMTSYGNLEVRQTGHADLHQALSGRSELEEQDESQSFIPTRDIDQNYLQQCKSSDGYDEADGTPRTPDIEEPEEQSSVHLDALESRNDIPVVSFEACSISDGPQTFPKSDNQTDSHEVRTCWQNFQMSRVIVANYVESEGKSWPTFMIFITICIILNTLFLALDRYPIDEKSAYANETANFIFYLIFVFEMILKIYGMGISEYCRDSFNIFDGIIVILSTVEVVLANSGVGSSGGNAISAFRAVRLLRLFKLAKSWKSLRKLLTTIQATIKDISYASILLLLFIFIYTLIGMEMYAYKLQFDDDHQVVSLGKSPRQNFDDFLHAFLLVYSVLVGDDWQTFMYDTIRATGYGSVFYFITLIVIGNIILLNLFLAILLGNFVEGDEKDETEIRLSKKISQIGSRLKSIATVQPWNSDEVIEPSTGDPKAQEEAATQKDKALYLFEKNHFIRRNCKQIVKWKHFDNIILVLIVISSILLAMDNPLNDPEGDLSITLAYLDMVMTILFTMEFLLKVVTFGFIFNGPKSYLKNGWNILDGFIVAVSVTSLGMGGSSSLNNVKALRTLRVLRPLRMIQRNENLKVAVNSLVSSIPYIGNVLIICAFFWTLIAILFVTYFKGSLFYCEKDYIPGELGHKDIETKQDWINLGGVWINTDANFDNTGNAILTLFIATTTEGWIDIMYSSVDAVGIHKEPQFEHTIGWIFFWIFYTVVSSFFLLNLLVGTVYKEFMMEQSIERGEASMAEGKRELAFYQAYMLNYKPIVIKKCPENTFRAACFQIAMNPKFDWIIIIFIILNTVCLSLQWYGEDPFQAIVIDYFNLVFTIIFILEAIIKISAFGRMYFNDGVNLFDFAIVIMSVVEIIVQQAAGSIDLSIITLFRIFRVGRILRLINGAKRLRVIFSTFILVLPQVANIGALLLLFIYIFAILGVQLFAKVKIQGEFNEYANFQEFWKAFMLLIRCSTGESWNLLMFAATLTPTVLEDWLYDPTYEEIQENDGQTNGCGTPVAYIYFVCYMLIVSLVFLSLFVSVIIDGYQDSESIEYGRLTGQNFEDFRKAWSEFDPDGTGLIKLFHLSSLLRKLDPPIGSKGLPVEDHRNLLDVVHQGEWKVFENQFHFWEVANSLATHVFGQEHSDAQHDEENIKMFQKLKAKRLETFNILKQDVPYNSQHAISIVRIQRRFKAMLYRIRNEKTQQTLPLCSLTNDIDTVSIAQHPLTPANATYTTSNGPMDDENQPQQSEDEDNFVNPMNTAINTVRSLDSIPSENEISNPINSEQSPPISPKAGQKYEKVHPA